MDTYHDLDVVDGEHPPPAKLGDTRRDEWCDEKDTLEMSLTGWPKQHMDT